MSVAPPVDLPVAEVDNGRLRFTALDDQQTAFALGAFLLRKPTSIELEPGLKLCRNFYKPADESRYRGHHEAKHEESSLGYEDRPDQVEQLQIEDHLWVHYFPDEVATELEKMRGLTLIVLEELLRLAGIRREHWETITGGARARTNLCYSTINHYRSSLDRRLGIVEHTDSGFITTICADQPGFEIYTGDDWRPVREQPGHFVVNTGDAFEVLTRELPNPIQSVLHRVVATHPDRDREDRSSYTVYMGPRFDMSLYQYTADGTLTKYQGFREFSVAKAARMGYEFHSRV